MHPTLMEELAKAHVDDLGREASAARLANTARRAREARTHRSRAGRLRVIAWRRALAAVALTVLFAGSASAA